MIVRLSANKARRRELKDLSLSLSLIRVSSDERYWTLIFSDGVKNNQHYCFCYKERKRNRIETLLQKEDERRSIGWLGEEGGGP